MFSGNENKKKKKKEGSRPSETPGSGYKEEMGQNNHWRLISAFLSQRQRDTGGKQFYSKVKNPLRRNLQQFTRVTQKNDDQSSELTRNDGEVMRQRTLCDRLLPQPSIGIYRNAISGKQMQRNFNKSEKKGKRSPGDVVKLLNSEGYLLKTSEETRASNGNQMHSLRAREASPRASGVVDKKSKRSPNDKEPDLPLKESLQTGRTRDDVRNHRSEKPQHPLLPEYQKAPTIGETESVRRWRWSPVTCFEEFCAQLSTKCFSNCLLEFPAPGVKISIFLKDMYAEAKHSKCDFDALREESETTLSNAEARKSAADFPSKCHPTPDDDEYRGWDGSADGMAHDLPTHRFENERNPRAISANADSNMTKLSRKRSRSRLSATKAENYLNFFPTSGDNPPKIWLKLEAPESYPNKSTHGRSDHTSHEPNFPFRPRTADSGVNKSLRSVHDRCETIPTPSIIFRLINHENTPNESPELPEPSAKQRENRLVGKPERRENCGQFLVDEEMFHATAAADHNYHHITKDSINARRHHSTVPKDREDTRQLAQWHGHYHSYDNSNYLWQNKWRNPSEAFKGPRQPDLLRFSDSSAPRKSIGRQSMNVKVRSDDEWRYKLVNKLSAPNSRSHTTKMHDAVVNNLKVLSFDDDLLHQAIRDNNKNENSGVLHQPSKYFAVADKYDMWNCPRRIAVYPHEYRSNEELPASPSVINSYYENADSHKVISPSSTADPFVFFNPQNKYKLEYPIVNPIRANKQAYIAQRGRDKSPELLHRRPWILENRFEHYCSPNCNNYCCNADRSRRRSNHFKISEDLYSYYH